MVKGEGNDKEEKKKERKEEVRTERRTFNADSGLRFGGGWGDHLNIHYDVTLRCEFHCIT